MHFLRKLQVVGVQCGGLSAERGTLGASDFAGDGKLCRTILQPLTTLDRQGQSWFTSRLIRLSNLAG
ncbi:hypothetical protein HYPDE_29933 [Hyphomicrobium denitrificans 1NES1]|uniref:Uncharacterized protein n=1 Tax=Hyphomicrobium denitrificans 1NES1 TaxID=670307 RepID=N0BAW2_9HYPH|nr:hypothetical protein HYPDE_29933 [Hyphomicrobium denitrificans 1NES1]